MDARQKQNRKKLWKENDSKNYDKDINSMPQTFRSSLVKARAGLDAVANANPIVPGGVARQPGMDSDSSDGDKAKKGRKGIQKKGKKPARNDDDESDDGGSEDDGGKHSGKGKHPGPKTPKKTPKSQDKGKGKVIPESWTGTDSESKGKGETDEEGDCQRRLRKALKAAGDLKADLARAKEKLTGVNNRELRAIVDLKEDLRIAKETEKKLRGTSTTNETLRTVNDDLRQSNQDCEMDRKRLKGTNDALTEENRTLRDDVEGMRTTRDEAQRQYARQATEMARLRAELAAKTKELAEIKKAGKKT
jgi:hypothetical protein